MIGVDFLSNVYLRKNISLESKLSWLKSENRKTGYAIIYMPPFYFENGVKIGIGKFLGIKDLRILMSGRYVAEQVNVNPDEDFLEVPSAYFLTNVSFSGKFGLFHKEASLSVSFDNLFDVNYRDYLSRFRYFSEEPGRAINFVLNYKF
jgi:iron complex outermembrane receptor protein